VSGRRDDASTRQAIPVDYASTRQAVATTRQAVATRHAIPGVDVSGRRVDASSPGMA